MLDRLKWLLPTLTLLAAMILLSMSSRQPVRGNMTSSMMMEVAGPLERLLSNSARAVENFWGRYLALVGLQQENEALREVVGRQQQQLTQLGEYKAAVERLNSLLGLRAAYPQLIMKPAHVLAWDPGPWFRSMIISVGSHDGVASGQAVIHDRGVVGRVVDVTPNYARVLLITDHNSSVDAFIQRTRTVGILSGQGAGPLSLRYVRKDEDVRPGDLVVTSGLDGFFPRGLALGAISRVDRHSADLFALVEVNPQFSFERLEEVMVLINQGPPVDWLSTAPGLRPILEEEAEELRRQQAQEGEAP